MTQLDVHTNGIAQGIGSAPCLLILQANLLDDLGTQVVAPLVPLERFGPAIAKLHPILLIGDQRLVLSTSELASISRRDLGPFVTNVEHYRDTVFAAVDLLFFGI